MEPKITPPTYLLKSSPSTLLFLICVSVAVTPLKMMDAKDVAMPDSKADSKAYP